MEQQGANILGALEGQLATSVDQAKGALEGVEGLELVTVVQQAAGVAAAGWSMVTAPFAIFGPDSPGVNFLFCVAFGLLAYNIVVQTPRN